MDEPTEVDVEAADEVTIRCRSCPWAGPPSECPTVASPYHDVRCPKCGTTDLDTSELCAAWAKEGRRYGYGDDNSLRMEPT